MAQDHGPLTRLESGCAASTRNSSIGAEVPADIRVLSVRKYSINASVYPDPTDSGVPITKPFPTELSEADAETGRTTKLLTEFEPIVFGRTVGRLIPELISPPTGRGVKQEFQTRRPCVKVSSTSAGATTTMSSPSGNGRSSYYKVYGNDLLFPSADAALPSSMFTIGDTAIPEPEFFDLVKMVGTLPPQLLINDGKNKKKEEETTKSSPHTRRLKSGSNKKMFDGWLLHSTNEDCGDGSEGRSGSNDDDDQDDRGANDDDQDDRGANDDDQDEIMNFKNLAFCRHGVQLLAIRANFHICAINAYDWRQRRAIYREEVVEIQEEGMVDLVPTGPLEVLETYGGLYLEVFYPTTEGSCSGTSIMEEYDVDEVEELGEYTQTIDGGHGKYVEVTYLVIPIAIKTYVEVSLNLSDLGCRSRTVYGKIKASNRDYGNKSIHLYSCGRERSLSFSCGSASILPLSPPVIALPYRPQLELHIEVDLTVVTISTCDSQEEDKNLKFCLVFNREITCQKRDVDGDLVEVNITWFPDLLRSMN